MSIKLDRQSHVAVFDPSQPGSDKIIGYVYSGGCSNPTCKQHIKAGLRFHALPQNVMGESKYEVLEYVRMSQYHYASLEQAIVALRVAYAKAVARVAIRREVAIRAAKLEEGGLGALEQRALQQEVAALEARKAELEEEEQR